MIQPHNPHIPDRRPTPGFAPPDVTAPDATTSCVVTPRATLWRDGTPHVATRITIRTKALKAAQAEAQTTAQTTARTAAPPTPQTAPEITARLTPEITAQMRARATPRTSRRPAHPEKAARASRHPGGR